jgi:hypothetical protein
MLTYNFLSLVPIPFLSHAHVTSKILALHWHLYIKSPMPDPTNYHTDRHRYCKDGPRCSLGNGFRDRFRAPPESGLTRPRAVLVRARPGTRLPHRTALVSPSSPRIPHPSRALNSHLDLTQNTRSSPVSAAAQALGSPKHRRPTPLVRAAPKTHRPTLRSLRTAPCKSGLGLDPFTILGLTPTVHSIGDSLPLALSIS